MWRGCELRLVAGSPNEIHLELFWNIVCGAHVPLVASPTYNTREIGMRRSMLADTMGM